MKEITGYSYYIKRIFSMPPHIAVKKSFAFVKTSLSAKMEKLTVEIFGADINDREFSRALVDRLPNAIRTFRERPNIFLSESALGFKDILSKGRREAKRIISSADRICEHKFDLLGSEETFLGDSIDWHIDFKTGYKWSPKKFYKDVEIPYGKGDIKVPWDLSRFQHLTLLGEAYQLAGDEKYAIEFRKQVSDWIDNNLPKLGPNWACTMEVAIRATNWLIAREFFKDSPSIDDSFISKFLKSILVHGRFIKDNLEYSEELTSNHYLSDLAGLFFIAAMVPEFRESKEWLFFARKELETGIKKQVYEDGCDFEASTCYHRLALELFFYPALLGKRRGIEFSEGYNSRFKKMFEAVLYLLKPNGKMPQIGDNDSGRLHIFTRREVLDMRYLLTLGAIFFNEPRFKVKEFGFCEEALWVFGEQGYKTWQDLEENTLEYVQSHTFSDAGWHIMRNNKNYMIISCGPNGQNGNGGHAHNDKLSFELCLDGIDVFIDPGTYVYTPDPEMRDLFRSTSYHNTVIVNNMEQNNYDSGPYGLFKLKDESKAKVILWESNKKYDHFIGEHFGYERYGFHHVREIYFKKSERLFEILDRVKGENPQSVACFYLKSEVDVENSREGVFKVRNAIVTFKGFYKIDIVDSWYSREYGVKEKSKCIKVFFRDLLETRISYKT